MAGLQVRGREDPSRLPRPPPIKYMITNHHLVVVVVVVVVVIVVVVVVLQGLQIRPQVPPPLLGPISVTQT